MLQRPQLTSVRWDNESQASQAIPYAVMFVVDSVRMLLKALELMRRVHQGAIYKDGIVIETEPEKVAA